MKLKAVRVAVVALPVILFFYSFKFDHAGNITRADTASGDTVATIEVKDRSMYSAKFLKDLKQFGYSKHYKLVDNKIIFGDTAYFPGDLPLNKEIIFKSCELYCLILKVKRINYTTVRYSISHTNPQAEIADEGQAHLSPGFILGAETDTDHGTGEDYLVSEYRDERKDCFVSIRVGKNSNDKLCARLMKGCADKNGEITLEADSALDLSK